MFSLTQPLDYTRFDYIVDNQGIPYFLEFNVCCNLGEHSTISQSANAAEYFIYTIDRKYIVFKPL